MNQPSKIFVTLGSQRFQFDRLLKGVDTFIQTHPEYTCFAQTGYSNYRPMNYEDCPFLSPGEFKEKISECDIVITHGGSGAIINGVKAGKKVIAVPRLKEYGEHVDNHQLEIVNEFDEVNLVVKCTDLNKLDEAISLVMNKDLQNYESHTQSYLEDISKYIDGLF